MQKYRDFIAANGIGIAGIEFITGATGEIYTCDVNTGPVLDMENSLL